MVWRWSGVWGSVDRLHGQVGCPGGALARGKSARGVGELAGEVGNVLDLLEVHDHVAQVVLGHGLEDGQVQRGRATGTRGEPGVGVAGVGEDGAQVGAGDRGHDELVVGQDAVLDRVRVGVGVQARAEDLRIVHRRDHGGGLPRGSRGFGPLRLGPCIGGLGQARGFPLVRGRGHVQTPVGQDAGLVVDHRPLLFPAPRRSVRLIHDQEVEIRGSEDAVLELLDPGEGIERDEHRCPLAPFPALSKSVRQVLPRPRTHRPRTRPHRGAYRRRRRRPPSTAPCGHQRGPQPPTDRSSPGLAPPPGDGGRRGLLRCAARSGSSPSRTPRQCAHATRALQIPRHGLHCRLLIHAQRVRGEPGWARRKGWSRWSSSGSSKRGRNVGGGSAIVSSTARTCSTLLLITVWCLGGGKCDRRITVRGSRCCGISDSCRLLVFDVVQRRQAGGCFPERFFPI